MTFNEDFVKRCILKYPNVHRLAIDVGAEHGRHVEHMVQRGFDKIWAFEPVPYNCKHIEDKHWGNVRLFQLAIGTQGGMRLWISEHTCGHTTNEFVRTHQWPTIPAWTFGQQFMDVPSGTLNDVWELAHTYGSTIGLLKVDIEGGEEVAFRHANRLLIDNSDWLWILLEVHDCEQDLGALYHHLDEYGYCWYDEHLQPVTELHGNQHYLVKHGAGTTTT